MSVLLVADGSPRAIELALDDVAVTGLESVASAIDAVRRDPPSALVVDDSSLGEEIAPLLRAVRSLDTVVPVVLVASDSGVSWSPRPVDRLVRRSLAESTLRTAVEQALLIGRYDETIGELFHRAKARATNPEERTSNVDTVRRLRSDADALLDDLVAHDDPDLLAALFSEFPGTTGEQ